MRPAVLVLDVIVDFTTGRLGNSATRAVRQPIRRLLNHARRRRIPVIYCQEAHTPGDPELRVWGKHGLHGTRGAQTDSGLKPHRGEPVVPKHTFDAFFGTNLEDILKKKSADILVLTGVCTDLCVQHTAADAFFRGYRILVPRDATAAFTPEEHRHALRFMARTYGAQITDVDSLLRRL